MGRCNPDESPSGCSPSHFPHRGELLTIGKCGSWRSDRDTSAAPCQTTWSCSTARRAASSAGGTLHVQLDRTGGPGGSSRSDDRSDPQNPGLGGRDRRGQARADGGQRDAQPTRPPSTAQAVIPAERSIVRDPASAGGFGHRQLPANIRTRPIGRARSVVLPVGRTGEHGCLVGGAGLACSCGRSPPLPAVRPDGEPIGVAR